MNTSMFGNAAMKDAATSRIGAGPPPLIAILAPGA
jgi:hypothetical protein